MPTLDMNYIAVQRLITTFEIITSLSVDVIAEPLKVMLNEKIKQNDGKR